ncbi:MAG: glycosyltransferase [Verrucomicrobia bacterium]|nr:glycosyltransferase [Verrucomicrobiota bacterium]
MTLPAAKSIRLLHIVDDLGRGGMQTWLTILVEGLAQRGYEQRVICLNEQHNAEVVENLERAGAPVTIIGRPAFFALIGFVKLHSLIKAWRPGIVQTILPYSDAIGRPVARLAGVKILVTSIQSRNVHVPRLMFPLIRLSAHLADKVIAVGRQAIPFAIEHEGVLPERAIYIPNSIHADKTGRKAAARAWRSQLGISDRMKVIGMVGRLSPKKAQRDLLSAYARIAGDHPDTVLVLVGDGPLRGRLEGQVAQLQIARRVIFRGDRSDVADLLAGMDLFVHPTLSEGMPHAVMEAMAAGLPVIASGVDGVLDLIVDGEHGWLVKPSAPEELAAKMDFALRHPELGARLGAAAVRRIAAEFSPEKMVAAYDAVYRELLAKAETRPS